MTADERDLEEFYREGLQRPKKKPKPKPPDASNPPSRWKNAPWTKKHVHIVYGLATRNKTGGTFGPMWTAESLVSRCLTHGAKAVFAQVGDDCPDPDWAQHARELYAAGKAAGLLVGGWGRADYVPWETVKAAVRSVMPLDGFLADVEGPCQDDQLPEHLVAEFAGEMPLGVIATGGIDNAWPGLSPGEIAVRFGDYFDFVGQDYYKTDNQITPDVMENFVYWRSTAKNGGKGFRYLPDAKGHWHVPVVMPAAETCPPLATYKPWLEAFGGPFGVWDAELIESNGEWDVFASIG